MDIIKALFFSWKVILLKKGKSLSVHQQINYRVYQLETNIQKLVILKQSEIKFLGFRENRSLLKYAMMEPNSINEAQIGEPSKLFNVGCKNITS